MWEWELRQVKSSGRRAVRLALEATELEQRIRRIPNPGGFTRVLASMFTSTDDDSGGSYADKYKDHDRERERLQEQVDDLVKEANEELEEGRGEMQPVLSWLETKGIKPGWKLRRTLFNGSIQSEEDIEDAIDKLQGLIDLICEAEEAAEEADQTASEVRREIQSQARYRGYTSSLGISWR